MSEKESTFTSYDLITDDLVKQALKDDVGSEAELISWETKDFTNKGDNYSSIVTSIAVTFEVNGSISETSYVAKLNPLRPYSSFTEFMEKTYAREEIVLREIMNGMNSHLEKLNQPLMRAPKLYSRSFEKGKEVIITENLRVQGFKMHDRNKGMDINHALLVVKELGRFHASSLLFEETLFPRNIPESFDHFEDPFEDVFHPSNTVFNAMMSTQFKSACEFLKDLPAYEKCVKWLNDRVDITARLYIDNLAPAKPFDVFTHGDCWTNNMLFKYDEEGKPVDFRFVDLQCARKSSPACDMNYFYYSSLNGQMRKKHMKTLEKVYYDSFSNIFKLAEKEPPFTFPEFETEMNTRKQFGLIAGLMVLPAVLAEGDETWELDKIQDENMAEFINLQKSKFALLVKREGPFKERYLSMFDEMIECKLFDD